jgi:peptidoglycan/xylan/chitin deacetylase (PgdA/CDA1 family)
MNLLIYVPNAAKKPVPAFLGLNFDGNQSVDADPGITMCGAWMRDNKEDGIVNNRATEATRGVQSGRWQVEMILKRGYALVTAYYGDLDPDFDDGFQNVLEFGLGPLAEHKCRAIQFLVADRLGGNNEWDLAEGEAPAPLMDEAQVRDWLAAGHEIGSHTLTHPWLTRLPASEAREEIAASRKKLEDQFGVPIEHFCYPYGDWNDAVRDLVVAAGYKTACTTQPGVNTSADSAFALKRFTARYPSRSLKAFWSRLRGGATSNKV